MFDVSRAARVQQRGRKFTQKTRNFQTAITIVIWKRTLATREPSQRSTRYQQIHIINERTPNSKFYDNNVFKSIDGKYKMILLRRVWQ